jgi:hypothetical protein
MSVLMFATQLCPPVLEIFAVKLLEVCARPCVDRNGWPRSAAVCGRAALLINRLGHGIESAIAREMDALVRRQVGMSEG